MASVPYSIAAPKAMSVMRYRALRISCPNIVISGLVSA